MSARSGMAAKRSFVWILAIGLLFTFIATAQAAQVTLAWDANDPTPDGYQLYQRTEGGTYDYAAPAWSGTGTSCSLDNLADETTYYYVVRAYSGGSESGDSNEVTFRSETPAPQSHTITASAGAYGQITPSGATTVTEGESQSYTISAFNGFHISDVTVDGVSVGAVSSYTFNAVGADHAISASFAVNTYTISASSGSNGSVSPAGSTSVAYSGSQVYTITPATGYHVGDVLVDGASVGAVDSYTFSNVSSSHTISASFAANSYTISSNSGANGSVSPAGSTSVAYSGSQVYTITPATGYHVGDVLVDGASVGAVDSYTFSNVSSSHTISASFAANSYTISSNSGANGSVSPAGSTSVAYSGSQVYTITPATGYHVGDVLVDGASVGAVDSYTFSNVSSSHTISASFTVNSYTISATAGQGGSIDPAGQVTVNGGGSQSFAISAESGYEVESVMIDGQNIGTTTGYIFDQVAANHSISVLFNQINQQPTADAGPDQSVDEAQEVTLSGLNSMDSDDGIASFSWRQIQGSGVELSDTASAEITFTAPDVDVEGEALVFELIVTDNSGATAVDSCIVNVSWVNEAPTAQAGADLSVTEGEQVFLDAGNSVDPDNGIAAYQWRQLQGPSVVLSDTMAVRPTFTAPQVDPQGASILFELTVTDGGGLQDTDRCIVTVSWSNTPPTADAGPDQQVAEGQEVYLNGSNSIDLDDGIASYQWRQTNGSPVVLSDPTAVQPTFFAPDVASEGVSLTFQLTVTDNGGLQHNDACTVNVSWENEAPVAAAGEDQTVNEGEAVQLYAGDSTDADDGISAYQWNQISGPAVTLSDPQGVQPTFNAPDVGPEGASLAFQLTVIDFSGLQSQDACIVNVTWQNMPPMADAGADQQATAGETVSLDGTVSADGDDGISSYRWKQIGGMPVTLQDTSASATTFMAPDVVAETTLEFELTVTDSGGLQSVDHCKVMVQADAAPVLDTTPPEVSITDPDAAFVFIRKSNITLRGVASDNKEIVRVVWQNSRGGSGEATGTTAWEIVDLKLSRWFNTITVTAYDAAGNNQSTTLQVFAGIWR